MSNGRTSAPTTGARATRNFTLLLLLGATFIVALMMVGSFIGFALKPDPAVKAGPMYVTLVLTTGAALLMFAMALNASYFPFMHPRQAPNVYLVLSSMGVTGIVTGLLTVGQAATPFAMRLLVAGIALGFITVQHARLTRARAAAAAGQPGPLDPQAPPRARTRQRRGGRKH